MNGLARLAARAFNTPLLIHEGKAEAMLDVIGARLAGVRIDVVGGDGAVAHVTAGKERLGTVGDALGRSFDAGDRQPYEMVGAVAILTIEGVLVHKGAWVGSESGETSYQGIQAQALRAIRDPAVRAVVFEVDSMGGEAAGAFEAADALAALSAAKPTLAILTDAALSAGYLLASQARQIVAPAVTGVAGSIGAIQLHRDLSRRLEAEGVRVTILKAGRHKGDGNPFQPLPEDVAARVLRELEAARQRFAAVVARGRGARLTAEAALATEADVVFGEEALATGLIDGVGNPNEAFDLFVTEINRAAGPT